MARPRQVFGGNLQDPGRCEVNVLRVASDVVGGTKVTIGADVYEIEIVNTDSTNDTAGGEWNNTTNPLTLAEALDTYPDVDFEVGRLIRVENEIMRVSSVDGTDVTLLRGQSGTTTAAHADAQSIFQGDGLAVGSTIAVGLVTTLTPTAFSPALVADVNEHGTQGKTAEAISVNEILFVADQVGAVGTAVSETLAGANNVWAASAFYGGAYPIRKRLVSQKRVPNATEVTLGKMYFQFPFVPVVHGIEVRVTSTGMVMA